MNLQYCKERGIRLARPSLGRPKKDDMGDKDLEYRDNADRVEVERGFSHLKGSFGLGLLRTKRKDTTLKAISLSIILKYLSTFTVDLCAFFSIRIRTKKFELMFSPSSQSEDLVVIQ